MPHAKPIDCFQALADPHRREILLLLAQEKQNINALADHFSISRPAVSKHIKVLYSAGFVSISEQGRERYCSLNMTGFEEVKEWIGFFEEYWKKQLKSLENFLGKPENQHHFQKTTEHGKNH